MKPSVVARRNMQYHESSHVILILLLPFVGILLQNSCASEQGVDKYCRLLQLMPGNVSITVLKKIVQMYFK